jgi:hypothetical protein
MQDSSKPALGQTLLRQCRGGLITDVEAFQMFINQVALSAIPAEVESLPSAFQRGLEEYLARLGIGLPGWENAYLVFGVYYFADRTAEEAKAIHRDIAKKNRISAEALWQYFGGRQAAR